MSSKHAEAAVSPIQETLGLFFRSGVAICGLFLLTAIVVTALLGPIVYVADPFEIVAIPLSPPGTPGAWLGTDQQGRDVLTGLIYGGRATLAVGTAAALISITVGIIVGALAGFFGGFVDEVLMRVTEFFQVLPALLFAMVITTFFGPTLVMVSFSIGIVSWPATARLARAEFLKIKQLDYVTAEWAIGATRRRIIWSVILPNAISPLVVSATFAIGTAILFEASLSFLGLSDSNSMSWGLMIGSSRSYMLSGWWAVTFPGLMIFLTVLAISLIGDGLNDALNPKLRERH